MQAKYLGIGAIIAVALVASTLLDRQPANDRSGTLDIGQSEPELEPPRPAPLEPLPPKVRYKTAQPGTVPPAIEGTHIDGSLKVDDNGQLVIDRGLRRLFDYFLLASAGEPLEDTLNRLRTHIGNRLDGKAEIEARELLEQYLEYKTRLFEIETQLLQASNDGTDPVERLARHFEVLAQLRRETLPPAAVEAFFAEEETYDRYILSRYRITSNPALSDALKQAELEQLDQSMPEELRQTLQSSYVHQRLSQKTQAMRAAGADESEIRNLRVAAIGVEATERLEKLDRDRAQWESRLQQYRVERAQILEGGSLQGEDLEQALSALRERHFSGREILRVEALDRIAEE